MDSRRWGVVLSLLWAAALRCAPACALTIPPPPDPGLEGSVRAADAIVRVEILAGGPFRACAAARRVFKGQVPKTFELEAFNTYNGDAAHGGLPTGSRWILFLSRTDRPDVFALLTPGAMRLPINEDGVLLSLGDPPFRIPIREADMEESLALLAERQQPGLAPARAAEFIRGLWERGEVEPRYLAVALAGMLREAGATDLVAEAARDKLLRLRLTAVEALKQIAGPDARAALRSLLKEYPESVAREAAAALVELRDVGSVGALLDWARRASQVLATVGLEDARRAKYTTVLNALLLFVLDVGPLAQVDELAPGLLALARAPDQELAATALYVLDRLAGKAQVQALLDLADDPVYPLAREATVALFRATLRPTFDLEQFRSWWRRERGGFGEAQKTAALREALVALALSTPEEAVGQPLAVVLAAAGELALPDAAPFLLNDRTAALFETRLLALWRTPLVLPFYLERLASDDEEDRRMALQGLRVLATRHLRLRPALRPLIRAFLFDPEPAVRRTAAAACGALQDAPAFPLLLDCLRGAGSYELTEAARAVYELSGRTLGFSAYELEEDNAAALARLGAWWEGLGAARAQWAGPLAPPQQPFAPGAAEADLEALCLGANSAAAGAAFAALWASRGPAEVFWERLLSDPRPAARAHGVLGRWGDAGPPPPALVGVLDEKGAGAELLRAVALPTLASLRGGRGPDLAAKCLEEAGAPLDAPWRRLALVSLGLADGEPGSLAFLSRALEQALAQKEVAGLPALDRTAVWPLRAVVVALCARQDATAILARALGAESEAAREMAVRALAARRCQEAVPQVLEAVGRAERFYVYDLARVVAPLLRPTDLSWLAVMLGGIEDSPRLAAAIILSERPELGSDATTRAALILALRDFSSTVRARAAEALGKIRARSAVPTLINMLGDYSLETRSPAITALAAIGDPDGVAAAAAEARRSLRINPLWLRALALNREPQDLALLLTASRSESWVEQRAAVEALGLWPDPGALARLLAVFRDNQSPYQTHAGEALAQGAPATVAKAMEEIAPDLNSTSASERARALYWLARAPAAVGSAPALKALDDPNPAVRQLADWVLRRRTGLDAGYDFQAPPGQREAATGRWRELLAPGPRR